MSREIKFRAWVETCTGKEMVNDWCLLNIEDNHFYATDITNERPDIWEVYSVMQFTGIHDKNGKEIYEGDVIEIDDTVCGNPIDGYKDGIYIVEYCMPDCAFCLVQKDRKNAISFNECMIYKIIGNIHQNPELL